MLLVFNKDQITGLGGMQACHAADVGGSITNQDGAHELRHFLECAFHASCIAAGFYERKFGKFSAGVSYNRSMQRKVFWLIVFALSVAAFWLPLWWQVIAIVPIAFIAWWVAYRSEWFE